MSERTVKLFSMFYKFCANLFSFFPEPSRVCYIFLLFSTRWLSGWTLGHVVQDSKNQQWGFFFFPVSATSKRLRGPHSL